MDAPSPLPAFKSPPRHVVLITVESLSADYMTAFGSTRNLTPNLDRLAEKSLFFTRLYATGTRTVRGLEALSLGTPPVPGQAVVRRPGNQRLSTVGQLAALQGFEPVFLYGGNGFFDNMNAYFGGNGYRIVDRRDIPADKVTFENAWGVADEVLFDQTIDELDRADAAGKRVFAQVMTTSNHRPYTYPDGRIDIPSPGGRARSSTPIGRSAIFCRRPAKSRGSRTRCSSSRPTTALRPPARRGCRSIAITSRCGSTRPNCWLRHVTSGS